MKKNDTDSVMTVAESNIMDVVYVDPEYLSDVLFLPDSMSSARRRRKLAETANKISNIRPKDEVEKMISIQMVACHEAAVECARRAMIPGQTFEGRDSSLKHAARLMTTFTRLLDTLNKYRGKGHQKVTVEHVRVESGGQAIVGNVESVPSKNSRTV